MILLRLLALALLLSSTVVAQASAPASRQAPADASQPAQPPVAKGKKAPPKVVMECVPASQAATLADQQGCVAGRVYHITEGETGVVRLGLCAPHARCDFKAVIHAHDREKVGDINYLRGRYIAITGKITIPRGHPQIRVRQREQLHIAGGDTPAAFDADKAAPPVHPQSPKGKQKAW